MYKIDSDLIEMTRGDSVPFNFKLVDSNNNPVELADKDVLLFTVRKKPKKNSEDTNYAFQKQIVNGSFKISPNDTKDLDYGQYNWDIEYRYNAGDDVETVLKGKLVLTEEVT